MFIFSCLIISELKIFSDKECIHQKSEKRFLVNKNSFNSFINLIYQKDFFHKNELALR
jgi:hypothetical protein